LYEYVDTTNQSGGFGVSGRDNYFMNKLYRSGWTYDGRTLGLPFIFGPFNTRTRVHQIGFTSIIKTFISPLKLALLKILGHTMYHMSHMRTPFIHI